MDMSNVRRIVLLGKTDAGKSSLANTIFGEDVYKIDHNTKYETKQCRAETRSVNGRSITLIDTPGFFDTDTPEEEMKSEILRCMIECAPGPHAFLIVLKVEKFTEQEQAVIDKMNDYFSEEVFKYATVVFTHGDQLPEDQQMEDYFHQNKLLSDLMKKCGGRCHVIDNRYWNENQQNEYRSNRFQVEEILNTIDRTLQANNSSYYTNEMLLAVEEEIQLEGENIRLLAGDMTEEEIREEAKGRVFKKFKIKLAGIGAGALLEALCGLVVPVESAVKLLKDIVKSMIGAAKTAAAALRGLGAKAARRGVAAAAAGGAEGAAAGGTAAITLGAVAGACAAAGAVVGGVKGYNAAEGAETAGEAAKRAAETVLHPANSDSIRQSQSMSKFNDL